MADRSERQLTLETAAAARMREILLTMTDDSETIRDTLEGCTDLNEAIRRVYWSILEDEIQLAGLKETITALEARQSRFAVRVERYRAAIEKGMQAGELTKLELPEATLSLRRVPPKVEVVNEAGIPPQFFDPQPPKLNKKSLKEWLDAGNTAPGAHLNNGSMSLSIRRA